MGLTKPKMVRIGQFLTEILIRKKWRNFRAPGFCDQFSQVKSDSVAGALAERLALPPSVREFGVQSPPATPPAVPGEGSG